MLEADHRVARDGVGKRLPEAYPLVYLHSVSRPISDFPLKFLVAIACLLVLSACASKDMGLAGGNMLGLAPVAPAPTGAEAVLGSMMDGPTAHELDRRDKSLSRAAIVAALKSQEAGKPQPWSNILSGHSGTVTPGPVYAVNDLTCRDYVQVITLSGRQETQRATACQQPDGSWHSLS